ncbi:MAG: extra-cytoplasmic solute receptor [Betaproteobacteria bacterium]|nr:extra-cytoplasmic solute receptor [Betaproteobacteria bacterium]
MTLLARGLVFAAAALAAGAAFAQNYPVKPIRLVVISPPGGTTDALARTFSQRITDSLGQAVVVDNKPGGGGVIAAATVVNAAADGYTLLFGNLSLSLMKMLHARLTFEPLRDFTPVAFIGLTDSVLVTAPGMPVKTVTELIAYIKARPGGLNYAGGTTGATAHLSGELFKMMTGTNIIHVPYKGTAAAITALIGGETQMAFLSLPPCVPLIQSGRLRGIAIGSAKRSAALPDMPTVAESGLPGFDVTAWNGILAPRGLPRPLIAKLNGEFNRVNENADVKEKALAQGTNLEVQTPEQFGAFLVAQTEKWTKVAKAAGMRAD